MLLYILLCQHAKRIIGICQYKGETILLSTACFWNVFSAKTVSGHDTWGMGDVEVPPDWHALNRLALLASNGG
jgi:hypothetical protein